MALPISIEDLLNKQRVESNRIEFKEGWNPTKIYRSICAFANDLDCIGGGYILIGVAEENGVAVRPVKGIEESQLDKIQHDIVKYNNLLVPFYAPKISVESVDDRQVIVLWVPTGNERPYQVPEDVLSKKRDNQYYVRYGTSSVIAKGDVLDELMELKNRTAFDERGHVTLKPVDISVALLRDHLASIGSKLADTVLIRPIEETLEQMNLWTGPLEQRRLKNVAAMMFTEDVSRWFPMAQVEVVLYPGGRVENPDSFVELPIIKGSVPQIIRKTMDMLQTTVMRQSIRKPENKADSARLWNYPYQALEEAVVNALYHRDYSINEPVEISVEPDKITILSYSGPDRSISADAIRKATILRSRKYKNRNLGDYLKELSLTEGRATGIPTIQAALKKNGSPAARIETDDERTFFLIDIPCNEEDRGLWERDIDGGKVTKKKDKKVTKNTVTNKSTSLAEIQMKVLLFCMEEKSASEIFDELRLSAQTKNYQRIINPLLEAGLLRLKFPEQKRIRGQKYKTAASKK